MSISFSSSVKNNDKGWVELVEALPNNKAAKKQTFDYENPGYVFRFMTVYSRKVTEKKY
jgi:hypothetical protein